MKARILDNLSDLAKGKATPGLMQLLQSETGWDTNLLQEKAKEVLRSVLHGYSYFSVSTIDSFFQKIITSFARDMGIYGGFTIEFDQLQVTEEVLDRIFLDLEKDPQLMEWLVRFTESRIEDNKGWDVRYEVKNLAGELYFDRFHQYFGTLEDEILDKKKLTSLLNKLKKERAVYLKRLKSYGKEGLELIDRHGLTLEDLFRSYQGPGGLLLKMADGGDIGLNSYVIKAYESKDNWYTKKSEKKDRIRILLEESLYDLYKEAIDYYQRHIRMQNTYNQVLKLFYNLGLYSNLLKKLKEYRQEHQVVLISDLSRLLHLVIGENDAPYIYERVGNYYHHYLMDEFQDTSVFQWHNFKPLVMNALAMGKYNMLVGDVKQSIYRWRGGDWQLLHNKVEQDIGTENIRKEFLNKNWRSRIGIISFNNILFKELPQQMGQFFLDKLQGSGTSELSGPVMDFSSRFVEAYEDVVQEPPEIDSDKEGGIISLHFISTHKKDESKISWTEQVFPDLVETIQKIQDQGYALKDIAILVRTKEEGKRVADYLLGYKNHNPDDSYQYDVISAESLFLCSSPAVNVVISFMKLILDHENTLSRINLYYWLAVLNRIPEIEKPNKIFEDAIQNGQSSYLDPHIFRRRNYESFTGLPLLDLLETITMEFDLENFSYEQAYLTGLHNVLLDYCDRHNGDLHSFIEWWEADGKKQSIKPAEGQNAIQILTIHQSKGLQFEMVIIPFCSWNLDHNPNSQIIWCHSDQNLLADIPYYPVKYESALLESDFSIQYIEERSLTYMDNLNLLYVAFTRSISGIFVFAALPDSGKIKSIGDLLYAALTDLERKRSFPLEKISVPDSLGGDTLVYISGEIPKSDDSEQLTDAYLVTHYKKGGWFNKITIRKQPDFFTREEGIHHPLESIHYGILLHGILSRIIRKDQTSEVMDAEIKSGNIKAGELQRIMDLVQRLWDLPLVDDWFSGRWKVKTEVPVLPRSGQLSRMDRVMIDGDHVIVVDFKTGIYRNEDKEQVLEYKEILQHMGYKKVEGYLLYIEKAELVEI